MKKIRSVSWGCLEGKADQAQEKEIKLSVFENNMIVYIGKRIEATESSPELMGLAIFLDTWSIYKSQLSFCILAMNNWKVKYKNNTI